MPIILRGKKIAVLGAKHAQLRGRQKSAAKVRGIQFRSLLSFLSCEFSAILPHPNRSNNVSSRKYPF